MHDHDSSKEEETLWMPRARWLASLAKLAGYSSKERACIKRESAGNRGNPTWTLHSPVCAHMHMRQKQTETKQILS